MSEKTEQEFVDEMKLAIENSTLEISEKVIRSALTFMKKQGWINVGSEEDVEAFFGKKIPKVLTNETSKQLNSILGLDLKLE